MQHFLSFLQVHTSVININKIKDISEWLNNDNNIYIGRDMTRLHKSLNESMWHNPYPYYIFGRELCLKKYSMYITNNTTLLNQLYTLKGKTLGCFCKPLTCHGDILVQLINDMEC